VPVVSTLRKKAGWLSQCGHFNCRYFCCSH